MSFKNLANAAKDTFIVSTPLSLSAITSLLSTSDNKTSSNFNALVSKSITSFVVPSGITNIGAYALANNTEVTDITIKNNITSIGSNAFANCTALTSITIPASVTMMYGNVFTGCTNLTDIYCIFNEGDVAGAPWGAPDTATIHYMTKEEYLRLLAEQAEEAAAIASTNATEVDPYPEMMEELKKQVS